MQDFNDKKKRKIEADIEKDFIYALEGVKKLPYSSKGGVFLAYRYYYNLFTKIKSINASKILKERIRISDFQKFLVMINCAFKHRLRII